jgi:hypothetical protein
MTPFDKLRVRRVQEKLDDRGKPGHGVEWTRNYNLFAGAGRRYYNDGNNSSATNNSPYRSAAALYDDAIGCINRSAVSVCEKRLLT